MNRLRAAVLCLGLAPSCVWAADSKTDLNQARSRYQQTVAQYGRNSPQATAAKYNLRSTRRSFHENRRQQQFRRARSR